MNKDYLTYISTIEEAYKQLLKLDYEQNREVFAKYEKIAEKHIRSYNAILNQTNLSHGERNQLQAHITIHHALTADFKSKLKFKLENNNLISGGRISVNHIEDRVEWQDSESIFNNRMQSGLIVNLRHVELSDFLQDAKIIFTQKIEELMESNISVKANTELARKFEKVQDTQTTEEIKYFATKSETILPSTDISQWFDEFVSQPLSTQVEDFNLKDSGWSLIRVSHLMVNVNHYTPLSGGTYFSTFASLPKFIQCKHAVINIQNFKDDRCLLWSIVASLHPASSNVDRTSSYPHYSTVLNYEAINFPTPLQDLPRFEQLNNLAINVYGLEKTSENSNRK